MAEDNEQMNISSGRPSAKDVKFERLALKDEEEYVSFLMDAYRDQFNAGAFKDRREVRRYWRWAYLDNPNADKERPLIWLCRLSGRIIAQVCFMPVELKAGDKYFRACWCQNVMILPEFRNMGLGYFLIKYAIGDLNDGETDILMAAGMNDNSYRLLKALGFSDLGFINKYIKPSLFSLASRKEKRNIRIEETGGFGPDLDGFWPDVSRNFSYLVKRDAKNLRWRFTENPFWDYRILYARDGDTIKGYAVLREGRLKGRLKMVKVGAISDILFDPEDMTTGILLLAGACAYLRKRADIVKCDILCEGMQRPLRSAGFLRIKSRNRFVVYLLSEEAKAHKGGALGDRARWCLTGGDSDLDLF